ncbi:MAG: hypothetical protein AVDCRST_MAG93-3534, partial [uncultured Chloroflexia bacterium]
CAATSRASCPNWPKGTDRLFTLWRTRGVFSKPTARSSPAPGPTSASPSPTTSTFSTLSLQAGSRVVAEHARV